MFHIAIFTYFLKTFVYVLYISATFCTSHVKNSYKTVVFNITYMAHFVNQNRPDLIKMFVRDSFRLDYNV